MHAPPCSILCTTQEVVKLLLAHEIQLNASAGDDMNALHFCAMKGHAEPAKLLIAAGVYPRSRSNKGSLCCTGV